MEQMEQVGESQVEVFENDISLYLSMFCEEKNIEDMKKESQSVWNAALMYIHRHAFNDKGILKRHENIVVDGAIMSSTFNAYNFDLVDIVCDLYIYLCMQYDKEVSIIGFSLLTGIDRDTIGAWGREEVKLSPKSTAINQKLRDFREESLSAKLATANKNPVGILAILNRHYQWNLPGVSREKIEKKERSPEQIAEQYGEPIKGLPEVPDS